MVPSRAKAKWSFEFGDKVWRRIFHSVNKPKNFGEANVWRSCEDPWILTGSRPKGHSISKIYAWPFFFGASRHQNMCHVETGNMARNLTKNNCKITTWIIYYSHSKSWVAIRFSEFIRHRDKSSVQVLAANDFDDVWHSQLLETFVPTVQNDTHSKFNIAPEKWWLEDHFPFRMGSFQGKTRGSTSREYHVSMKEFLRNFATRNIL